MPIDGIRLLNIIERMSNCGSSYVEYGALRSAAGEAGMTSVVFDEMLADLVDSGWVVEVFGREFHWYHV